MNKLLAHFRRMQEKTTAYLVPEPYTDMEGQVFNSDKIGGKSVGFVNDLIYMLDGPEQREAEADASFDYVAEAGLTLSNQFHGELVGRIEFWKAIDRAIFALGELDKVKKSIFYGRDNALMLKGNVDISDFPQMLADWNPELTPSDAANFIHGTIGLATEAGEMLELLSATLTGKTLDRANLQEEVGDGKWYMAILAKVGGFMWGDDERVNIQKLRKRFPNAFTEHDANNRNLAAERVILEGDASNQILLPMADETAKSRFEANMGINSTE